MDDSEGTSSAPAPVFKMPVLVGKIGKLPRKAKPIEQKNEDEVQEKVENPPEITETVEKKPILPPAKLLTEMSVPIPYKEPKWSGVPEESYSLEVLKSGMIIDNIDLTSKPFFVFGRLSNSDVVMQHPTISRHHAVVQYKVTETDSKAEIGFYIYDLGSTHGTFVNKTRIEPHTYIRLRVGHIIKLGCSSRNYILLGPQEDAEQESELTITETKELQMRLRKEREEKIREAVRKKEMEIAAIEKKRDEMGATWGMGDDDDPEEETDLSENPFASTNNEELYLNDPKKTLRGYFEREGLELVYNCEEKGIGQFLCRVELPMDDPTGKPTIAEVIHKGKKKEAVIQCAMEACRILDRHGLLRQSEHESRRRKERDWSAEDFYDSDDDNFLDRTGSIEKKRKMRMRKYGNKGESPSESEQKPLTYDDLLRKCTELESSIKLEEQRLEALRQTNKQSKQDDTQDDPLDSFMSDLKKGSYSMSTKADISNAKMRIQKLRLELTSTQRLADIAKPAEMPALIKQQPESAKSKLRSKNSVIYGKRLLVKNDIKPKTPRKLVKTDDYDEFVEEVDSDEEMPVNQSSESVSRTGDLSTKSGDLSNKSDESSSKSGDVSNKSDVSSSKSGDVSNKSDVSSSKSGDVSNKSDVSSSRIDKADTSESKARVFGPMRPPENYVIPESYFEVESDRDLPEITEKE